MRRTRYIVPQIEKGIGERDLKPYVEGTHPDVPLSLAKNLKVFSEPIRYGFAVGRIRVLEMRLLSPNRLARLVEADFDEALNILDEVEIGDYLKGAKVAGEVDADLTRYLRDFYDFLRGILPQNSYLMDFFLCRYDFHNLKVLLKAGKFGIGEEGFLPGLGDIDEGDLRAGLGDPARLPSPYQELVLGVSAAELSPQELDTIVDSLFLAHRLKLAELENSVFVEEYVRASIDLANLKVIVRSRNLEKSGEFIEGALVSGGHIKKKLLVRMYAGTPEKMMMELEGNRHAAKLLPLVEGMDDVVRLTDFDRRADDYLMDIVKRARRISIGVEPIFAYVRARENEVTIIRILLMGKLHNLPPVQIEKMLRKLYIE